MSESLWGRARILALLSAERSVRTFQKMNHSRSVAFSIPLTVAMANFSSLGTVFDEAGSSQDHAPQSNLDLFFLVSQ